MATHDFKWVGSGTGDWQTESNWQRLTFGGEDNKIPDADDNAIFESDVSITLGGVSIGSIMPSQGAHISLQLSAGSLNIEDAAAADNLTLNSVTIGGGSVLGYVDLALTDCSTSGAIAGATAGSSFSLSRSSISADVTGGGHAAVTLDASSLSTRYFTAKSVTIDADSQITGYKTAASEFIYFYSPTATVDGTLSGFSIVTVNNGLDLTGQLTAGRLLLGGTSSISGTVKLMDIGSTTQKEGDFNGGGQVSLEAGAQVTAVNFYNAGGLIINDTAKMKITGNSDDYNSSNLAGNDSRIQVLGKLDFYKNFDNSGKLLTDEGGEMNLDGDLTNTGEIFVDRSNASRFGVRVGGTLTNYGDIDVGLRKETAILAVIGSLDGYGTTNIYHKGELFAGNGAGNGTVNLYSGGDAYFDAAVGADLTVHFDKKTKDSTLTLKAPESVDGAITGFSNGNFLKLSDEHISTMRYNGSSLAFTTTSGHSGALSLTGTFPGLVATADGDGTLIKVGPASYTMSNGMDIVAFAAGSHTVTGRAAAFDATDSVTGGGGTDTLSLIDGGTLKLGALAAFSGFEQLRLDDHSYKITLGDKNVATGQTLAINGANLTASHGLVLDAAAEAHGRLTVTGGAGADDLQTGGGSDIVDGRAGKDSLAGGAGIDTFVFGTGYGADTAADFIAKGRGHDMIDLSDLQSVTNWADLKAHHLTRDGSDMLIDGGHGDVLTLHGVKPGDLSEADFIF
jgi:hypothetical protein